MIKRLVEISNPSYLHLRHSQLVIEQNNGYVHIKDLLDVSPLQQNKSMSIKLVRTLPRIRPSTSLRAAVVTMQRQGAHLAEVVDKKGKTIGVVALEDLLEELVGDIRDDAKLGRKAAST